MEPTRRNTNSSGSPWKKKRKLLEDKIGIAFGDAHRIGAPGKFTPVQIARICQLACTPPKFLDLPFDRWSIRELTAAIIREKIVDSISSSSVHRILNGADIRPHLVKGWVNANPEDPATFEPRVRKVTSQYLNARNLHEKGVHVISMDEKPGIQAIEPLNPTLHVKPGLVERREPSYKRHGTTCLIGSFEVATGLLVHYTIQPTRTELDFLEHVKQTIAADPDAEWIILTDQLNTHMSESLVRFVAEECVILKDLGVKGRSGILKGMSTRAKFLENESHRIRFVYTPKHCSWLNQIECWFSILTRKALKLSTFTSVENLACRIRKFIEHYNTWLVKPFKWTYTGRPLASA